MSLVQYQAAARVQYQAACSSLWMTDTKIPYCHTSLVCRANSEFLLTTKVLLQVNFDREVMQLIREAKVLSRIGLPLPDMALQILQQEGRLKRYQDKLKIFLDEFNELESTTPPRIKPLLVKFSKVASYLNYSMN